MTILACITGALRAKQGERSNFEAREEYESRIEGRRKNKALFFLSSPHLAFRAKCRVRLAWLIKRLLCACAYNTDLKDQHHGAYQILVCFLVMQKPL